MIKPLTKDEVHQLINALSENQRDFLFENSKQSKKSKWLEVLSHKRAISKFSAEEVNDLETDNWVLIDILIGLPGTLPFKCECGRPLNKQYIVLHKGKNKTYKLGETCLTNYTSLSPQIIKDVVREFHLIDLERDEILKKFADNDIFNIKPFIYLKEESSKVKTIIKQSLLGLPLSDRQINDLKRAKKDYETKKMIKSVFENLNRDQKFQFEKLNPKEKAEIAKKIKEKNFPDPIIPDEFDNKEVLHFLDINLPLLNRHLDEIRKHQFSFSKNEKFTPSFPSFIVKKVEETPVKNKKTTKLNVTYDELLSLHLDTLKLIRENEHRIAPGLIKDWLKIQSDVKLHKDGNSFDYSSFKTNISMLIIQLGLPEDKHL